jgi:hypothetical protein
MRIRSFPWCRKMVRFITKRLNPVATPIPHRLCYPKFPAIGRNQRFDILFQHAILHISAFLRPSISTHVWLSPDMVFRRKLHPLAPHRSCWSTTIIAQYDIGHGSRDDRPDGLDLQCPKQHLNCCLMRYWRSSHALPLRRRFHDRVRIILKPPSTHISLTHPSFQATVWVYPSEILPLRLRQRGSSVSTACNWIFNYMIVQITPIALNNIGYKTYIIFAVLNSCWVPIIYFLFPETKGLELEDVDRLFAKDDEARQGLGHRDTSTEKFDGIRVEGDGNVVV